MMSILMFAIGFGLGVPIFSTSKQALEPAAWKVVSERVVNGCMATDTFAAPTKQGMSCVARVERSMECGGTEKSSYEIDFVAMLPNRRVVCHTLEPVPDFFPSSVFGQDKALIPLLRKASKLLKREASRPSSRFQELGRREFNELRKLQMSALDSVEVDTSNLAGDESYLMVFHLPECRCSVALYLSQHSSRYEWTRLVE